MAAKFSLLLVAFLFLHSAIPATVVDCFQHDEPGGDGVEHHSTPRHMALLVDFGDHDETSFYQYIAMETDENDAEDIDELISSELDLEEGWTSGLA
ncbi:unnamed protein product [Linum trigynum]|uniref:Uncharacterized protein n=1 Tax=Linum trigynum TaxID=586398 RepID=A0AAV2DMV3_9ROSI